MARLNRSKFAARKGKTISCGKCRQPIAKGESYLWWKPRSAYRPFVRCNRQECYPKQSEMDQSKMSGVWAAIEDATANLEGMRGEPQDDTSAIEDELRAAAESINDVAQEYRDANDASPTGYVFGEDLNEKADSIESGAQEIESWSADEEEPDYDSCENPAHDLDADSDAADRETFERGDTTNCEDCASIKDTWWSEQIDSAINAMSDASFD